MYAPFVLVSTRYGPLIVNRLDFDTKENIRGVGLELLATGQYQQKELNNSCYLIQALRKSRGDGLIVVDGGANIGVMTVLWADMMREWGQVIAVEPQIRTYYALCGNITLNNLFNVQAINAALAERSGSIAMPQMDPTKPANFGGASCGGISDVVVQTIAIDQQELERCDFIKLDIEGMELEAIAGAKKTIELCRPIMMIEHIKIGVWKIKEVLPDYGVFIAGMNVICIHRSDEIFNKEANLLEAA